MSLFIPGLPKNERRVTPEDLGYRLYVLLKKLAKL